MKRKKLGRPAPNWLKMLPKGEYTLTKLIKLSGKRKSTIVGVLKRHKVLCRYEHNNIYIIAVYNWKGFNNEQ